MIKAEIDPMDLMRFKVDMHNLDLENLLRTELSAFARDVRDASGKYPYPQPKGTRYKRTHHLYTSWYFEMHGTLEVEVGNLANYAGWVHGRKQVALHAQTGWKRLHETGAKMMDAMVKQMQKRIDRLWRP